MAVFTPLVFIRVATAFRWQGNRMRKVNAMVALVIAAVIVVILILSYAWINWPVRSGVETLNPEGEAGSALVVYHSGLTDFQRKVSYAFAEGLTFNGWRVDLTTASPQAPTVLSSYDLLVVGGPTYYWMPARPIRKYVKRLDLGGRRVVTIITGMGAGTGSSAKMQQDVREAHGDLLRALLLYKMAPNDEDNYEGVAQNQALAVEMAMQAGRDVPLP